MTRKWLSVTISSGAESFCLSAEDGGEAVAQKESKWSEEKRLQRHWTLRKEF